MDDEETTSQRSTTSTTSAGSHGSSDNASWASDEFGQALPPATEAMLNAIIDTVVVTNQIGKIVFVNGAAERMFGYAKDELLMHNVSLLMPEPFKRMHQGYMTRYLNGGTPKLLGVTRDLRAVRKDGTIFPVSISLGRISQTNSAKDTFFIATMRLQQSPTHSSTSSPAGSGSQQPAHPTVAAATAAAQSPPMRAAAAADTMSEDDLMEHLSEVIANREMSLDAFYRLTPAELAEMGITKLDAQMRLLELVARKNQENQLRAQSQSEPSTAAQSSDTERSRDSFARSPVVRPRTPVLRPPEARTTVVPAYTPGGEIDYDDLEFFEAIGRGAFGVVYNGKWRDMRVAIKKLMIPCDDEVRLMAQIRHRNIVTCLGYCANPPEFCMVIELAKYNLKHAIKHFPPSTDGVFDWALQIAQGMDYLHRGAPMAIIHRDLKPANVLVFSNNVLKIADFGLSRAREDDESARQMSSVGTFEYMAPEVIKSERYSDKCDVYSFGVLVWEMTTRQGPYQGIPPLSVAFGVGSGTLRLNIPARAPEALQKLLKACLAYDQHQRPAFNRVVLLLEEGIDAQRRRTDDAAGAGSGSDLGSDSSQSSVASWSTESHTSARDFFSTQVRQQGPATASGHATTGPSPLASASTAASLVDDEPSEDVTLTDLTAPSALPTSTAN